jgi:hypothetical protein
MKERATFVPERVPVKIEKKDSSNNMSIEMFQGMLSGFAEKEEV